MSEGVMAFSSNSLFLFSEETSVPYKGLQKGRRWDFELNDIDAITDAVPGIKYISGMLLAGRATNNIVCKDKYVSFSLRGFHSYYMKIYTQFL